MKNSKVEIYKIITGFILIIGLILGLIAGTNSKSIAVFFWTILSAIILVTFIMGIYSICKRLDILINPKLNIEKENYMYELKQGRYRNMTKIYNNFKRLNVDVENI